MSASERRTTVTPRESAGLIAPAPVARASAHTRPPLEPTLRHTTPLDPAALVVLLDLTREYDERYRGLFGEPASAEINRYPAATFSAPNGTFLVLERDGAPVSAGAFMTIAPGTVEVKRMWTHVDERGNGLARLVLTELENEARRRGNTRVVLSTGPRQPEAVRLYLATGYTPLFDTSLDPEEIVIHHFEKELAS
jgi:GNAT superfamily N-acetyltransferase